MGILDFMGSGVEDPRFQAANAMAQSLLGRGGGLQRLAGGLGNYGSVLEVLKNQELKRALAEAQIKETEAQAENRRQLSLAAEQKRAEALRAQAEQEAFFRKYSSVRGADANAVSGITGPRPEAAAMIGQRPPIDPFEAMRVFGPEMAPKIMDAPNWGMPEVARTIDSVDAKGNKIILQFDKQGRPIGNGVSGYVKPELVDTGGRKTFALPNAGTAFDVTMNPGERDASARGWAGLRQSADQFNRRLALDGTAPPKVSAAQEKADLEKQKAGQKSEQMLEAVDMARELLNKNPTASGLGAATDAASRFFGSTSDSAQTAAKLETLSGWMVANVPRMEGPQSNFDVENYKTMAAKVGDRRVPVAERKAALKTLEELHRKYAEINGTPLPARGGSTGGWSIKKVD